jgi:hypothetical protein
MMITQARLTKTSVETIVEHIFSVRQITRTDQQLLMSTLLTKNVLSGTDELLINRVFDALRKGLIRVVD